MAETFNLDVMDKLLAKVQYHSDFSFKILKINLLYQATHLGDDNIQFPSTFTTCRDNSLSNQVDQTQAAASVSCVVCGGKGDNRSFVV